MKGNPQMAKRVRDARKAKGLTHRAIAVRLGITEQTYKRWEDAATLLAPERYVQLAPVLGLPGLDKVPPSEFTRGEEDPVKLKSGRVLTPDERRILKLVDSAEKDLAKIRAALEEAGGAGGG